MRAVDGPPLLTSAAATALLIAPVAHHRMLFRQGRKPDLVRTSHRMALGGLALLLVAMASSVLLASDVVLDRWAAIVVAAVSSVWFVVLWAVVPSFRRQPSDPAGPSDTSGPSDRSDRSGDDRAQRVRHR
jgi:Family of unknown function (DUF6328)